ncbi:MAG: iron-siderophore ABC transporter substrate-binding protein [Actinomycetota bacterium]
MLRSRRFLALLFALALVAVSCGGDSDDESTSPSGSGSASASSESGSSSLSASASASEPATEDDSADPAEETEDTADDAVDEPAEDEPAVADEPAFPRTVTDALGEVEVAEAPLRVVALDMSLVDVAFVLQLEVIGHTTFMEPNGPIPELYGDAIDEFAADSVWMGDLAAPNLELIAAAQPDMIITSAVRHENIADQLSQIATTVMTESAGAGWKDSLRLIAEATGREDLAEAALADYEGRAAAIGSAINEAHDNPTLSVVRFVDVIRLYQPPSFSGTVLTDAGIARPESQQDPDDFISIISEEELPLADADWLVYAIFPNEDVEAAVTERQDSPLWTTLSVVANDRAFAVADERWMSGVGLFGANAILDDLEEIFGVSG